MGQIGSDAHPAAWSGIRKAYSLTFYGDQVSVCLAERKSGKYTTALIYEGLADLDIESWRRILRDMQAEQAVGQAVVSAALPSTLGFVVPLATPLSSRTKALKVMPGLLDLELPFPVEQCRFALLDVHTTGTGGVQSLTVGARDRDVAEQRNTWSALKVAPSTLDVEGLVLWDQWRCECLDGGSDAYQALLHFHADRSTLVLGSHEHVHTVRSLHQGAESPLERFKPALLRMLRGQEEVSQPQAVWVSGRVGDARLKELRDLLHDEGWPPYKRVPAGETLLERGTALRALKTSHCSINLLLSDEQPDSLLQHHKRKTRGATVIGGVCGICMMLAGIALKQSAQKRLENVDQAIRQKAIALTGYAASSIPRNQEVLVVSRALEEKGSLDSLLLTALQPSLSEAVAQISRQAEQHDVQLQMVQVSPRALKISGKGKGWSNAEHFVNALSVLGRDLGLRRFDPSDASSTAFIITQRAAP